MDDRVSYWRSDWVWHEGIQEWVWMSGRSIKRLRERERKSKREQEQREQEQEQREQEQREQAGQENPLPHTMGIPVHFNFKFGFKIKGSILFPN